MLIFYSCVSLLEGNHVGTPVSQVRHPADSYDLRSLLRHIPIWQIWDRLNEAWN